MTEPTVFDTFITIGQCGCVIAVMGGKERPHTCAAKAWDEGFAARAEYEHRHEVPQNWPDLNPYRAEGASHP